MHAQLNRHVNAKGQTTIPAEIRRKLVLKSGDRILYLEEEGRVCIVAADRRARDLKSLLPRPGQPVSLEDMNEVIATGLAR